MRTKKLLRSHRKFNLWSRIAFFSSQKIRLGLKDLKGDTNYIALEISNKKTSIYEGGLM